MFALIVLVLFACLLLFSSFFSFVQSAFLYFIFVSLSFVVLELKRVKKKHSILLNMFKKEKERKNKRTRVKKRVRTSVYFDFCHLQASSKATNYYL